MNYKTLALIFAALAIMLGAAAAYSYMTYGKKAETANAWADYYHKESASVKSMAGIKGNLNDIHIHSDFLVMVNGKKADFNKEEYDEKNPFMHLHLDNPNDGDKVIHIEGKGITLAHFFNSLDLKFTSSCLNSGSGTICADKDKELQLYVNGERNYELDDYEPENNDKILILFGKYSEAEIQEYISQVSEYARNYKPKV